MQAPSDARRGREVAFARALVFAVPVLFTANQVAARVAAGWFPPAALGFWRWLLAVLILLPFVWRELDRHRHIVLRQWPELLLLGALGMGVCGAGVYAGAESTTATNIGIIYAASPVFIILLARLGYGEAMSLRQVAGVALALLGVAAIVMKGDPATLSALSFVPGDLWIASAAVAWAVYSVLLLHRPSPLGVQARLCTVALGGVIVLVPFLGWETAAGLTPPLEWRSVAMAVFVATVPAVGAYQAHAYCQRKLGAAAVAPMMYLNPLYTAAIAWVVLDERMAWFHWLGAALILPGIFLATHRPAMNSRPSS